MNNWSWPPVHCYIPPLLKPLPNGSEFKKRFDQALTRLDIPHYHSRVRTPKDNAVNERFNRTLEDEFLAMGHLTADTVRFNTTLTEWLAEYNFKRPHQTLWYLPPINFHFKTKCYRYTRPAQL